MSSNIRLKRRWTGAAGAPSALKSGEPAFNGVDGTLYIGIGDDGSGNATSIIAIGGAGAFVANSQRGAVNGVATLDGSGKVPATQLPSYVDDVLEFANLAAFPVSGSSGLIYVALDSNKIYRWSGSVYAEISASPGSTDAVTEGASNLYFTDSRARAAVITQAITNGDTTHAPSGDVVFDQLALKANQSSLGSMAGQNANNVAITGGSIDGVTFDGGTF